MAVTRQVARTTPESIAWVVTHDGMAGNVLNIVAADMIADLGAVGGPIAELLDRLAAATIGSQVQLILDSQNVIDPTLPNRGPINARTTIRELSFAADRVLWLAQPTIVVGPGPALRVEGTLQGASTGGTALLEIMVMHWR